MSQSVLISQALREKFTNAGQAHVFDLIDNKSDKVVTTITTADIETFATALLEMDLDHLDKIFKSSTMKSASNGAANVTDEKEDGSKNGMLEPLDSFETLAESEKADRLNWMDVGLEAIANGQVSAIVLAGGQGTRLGFSGPKGCYDIGLTSGASLFELFAQRLLRLGKLAAEKKGKSVASIPFYIMTSPMNDASTRDFFTTHDYFGLSKEDVFFFPQGTLPCFTPEGKLMLETPTSLCRASDGNGGFYPALEKSGALADMMKRGVKYTHVFAVDNAMCKAADPVFIGYCISQNADLGNKVVWKNDAEEKVGIVAKKGGKYCIVEYNEMDAAEKSKVDPTSGKLVYGAGNICNHFYTTAFLHDVILPALAADLSYHVAHKKIPIAHKETGVTTKPEGNNGIKLEAFIFDVFPLAKSMAVLSVPRADEFSPVKNAPGNPIDSPDSAREMMTIRSTKWIVNAGGTVNVSTADDAKKPICEVHPKVSYDGEALADLVEGKTFDLPLLLK